MSTDPRKSLALVPLMLVSIFGCQLLPKSQDSVQVEPNASTLETTARSTASSDNASLPLGVSRKADGFQFTIKSMHAEKVQLLLFAKSMGEPAKFETFLEKVDGSTWSVFVPKKDLPNGDLGNAVLYGYRFWGPNWKYSDNWKPGSSAGFISHVDIDGNRFNPNKLLFDPYAMELTHDPRNPEHRSGFEYASGPEHYLKDNALVAPKGIYVDSIVSLRTQTTKVTRLFKDEIIYEAHVRGLTKNNLNIEERLRGTYKGATFMIPYLKELGITAIQFLPVQETQNDHNDIDPKSSVDDQYWGYMTLNYFSPERRYSSDKSPGGPTREFQDMVRQFHAAGIKVYLDVVYNHTGEGGVWDSSGQTADLLSFRGIDNQSYYQLADDRRYYYDNTGCGHNINSSNLLVTNLVIDSLKHWSALGVDGFRFDLAAILGNDCERSCARFNKQKPDNILNRSVRELPSRDVSQDVGIDLIAEPWAIDMYALGKFPWGWAEWNGSYRDTLRKKMNKLGYENVTPGELARILSGSTNLYATTGRSPYHSVNLVVAHDGFTLRDLFSYNEKNNNQPWPNGPSQGGEDHNVSWDQDGSPADQMKGVKNALAFLMLSVGTPMITAGDEQYRTQLGNNNAYNLDTTLNWLDWSEYRKSPESKSIFAYTKNLISLRKVIGGVRRFNSFSGTDLNGQNGKDITWLHETGEMVGSEFDRTDQNLIGYRLDLTEEQLNNSANPAAGKYALERSKWKTLVVYFNFDTGDKWVTLPKSLSDPSDGSSLNPSQWKVVANSSISDFSGLSGDGQFRMEKRSSIVFIELK